MENYHFQVTQSFSLSHQSQTMLSKEFIDQFNSLPNTFNQIAFSDNEFAIDSPNKLKIKTSIFTRRPSIQESQESSKNSQQKNNGFNADEGHESNQEIKQEQTKDKPPLNMKRNMKRSQTCMKKEWSNLLKVPGCKLFLKKTNSTIVQNFEQVRKYSSSFTQKLRETAKQHLRTIQVKYFRTQYTKVLFIDKETTAIEFILLALKEFSNESKFDQNEYQYKNFSLAYQLETLEDLMEIEDDHFRKPVQRTQSFVSQDDGDFRKSRKASYEERAITSQIDISNGDFEDKTITIDYPAILSCKQVEIVVNTQLQKTFGIDLETLKITQRIHPENIIIMIEDNLSQRQKMVPCNLNETISDLFIRLSNSFKIKCSQDEYFLRLKYPCIHYGIGPLNGIFPIKQLPIHWLVLEQKFQQEIMISTNIDPTNKISNYKTNYQNYEEIFPNMNDSEGGKDRNLYFQQIFQYQQFILVQVKNGQCSLVNIGIDYFDIYIEEQESYFKENKTFLEQFFQFVYKQFFPKPKVKVIKLKNIKDIQMNEQQNQICLFYKSRSGTLKKLLFQKQDCSDKTANFKFQKQLNECFSKLFKLIQIRHSQQFKSIE